jgi:hypothetical protein
MPLTAEKIWRVLRAHPWERRLRLRRAEAVGYALELVERRACDRDPVAIPPLERVTAPLARTTISATPGSRGNAFAVFRRAL